MPWPKVKGKAVKPKDFLKVCDKVLDLVRNGLQVSVACDQLGVSLPTVKDNVPAETYARAREDGFEQRIEREVRELRTRVESGELDANQARIILDAIKWEIGKLSQKFGDKQVSQTQVNIQNNVAVVSPADALKQLIAGSGANGD